MATSSAWVSVTVKCGQEVLCPRSVVKCSWDDKFGSFLTKVGGFGMEERTMTKIGHNMYFLSLLKFCILWRIIFFCYCSMYIQCIELLIKFLWEVITFFIFLDQPPWSHFDTDVSEKHKIKLVWPNTEVLTKLVDLLLNK